MIPSIEVENTQGTGSLLLSRGEEGITVTMTFVDFDSSLTAYDALAIETPMGTFPAEALRDAVRILAGEPTGEPTGEPSDAAVLAALNAHYRLRSVKSGLGDPDDATSLEQFSTKSIAYMRAAVRAATRESK